MKLRKRLVQILKVANCFYRAGFHRPRFNFKTVGAELPVNADIVWLDTEKKPLLAARLAEHSHQDALLDVTLFTVEEKENKDFTLRHMQFLPALQSEDGGEALLRALPLNNAVLDALRGRELLSPEADELKLVSNLLKLKDSSRKGIMENFVTLAEASYEQYKEQEKSGATAPGEPRLFSSFYYKPIDSFAGKEEDFRCLAEYIIHFLTGYDLAKITPEGLAELLDYSPKEKEFLLYYEFINLILGDRWTPFVYIPFMGDGIYAYSLLSRKETLFLSVSGNVSTQEEKRWVEFLLNLTNYRSHKVNVCDAKDVPMKEPKPTITDYIFLLPPFDTYITDRFTLSGFHAYRLTNRKKERLEVLALERSVNLLASHNGLLFALMSHSFVTITPYHQFRQYLLEEAEVKAILALPPGVMQKRWGYQLDFLCLRTNFQRYTQQNRSASEKVYIGKLAEFSRDALKEAAQKIRGVLDD